LVWEVFQAKILLFQIHPDRLDAEQFPESKKQLFHNHYIQTHGESPGENYYDPQTTGLPADEVMESRLEIQALSACLVILKTIDDTGTSADLDPGILGTDCYLQDIPKYFGIDQYQ
jgi:hypothetical protein